MSLVALALRRLVERGAQASGGGIYAEATATLAGNASCSNPHVVGNELYQNSTGAGPQIFQVSGSSC